MHPGNPGEKAFVEYVNKISQGCHCPVQFAPVRAIAGMKTGNSITCCLVAFERSRTEKELGKQRNISLISVSNGLLVQKLC